MPSDRAASGPAAPRGNWGLLTVSAASTTRSPKLRALAKLDKDEWHPRYIEPQSNFASGLLGMLLPQPAGNAATDLFGHAALRQQMTLDRIIGDMQMLMTATGAHRRAVWNAGLSLPVLRQRLRQRMQPNWLGVLLSRS
jgi:hypothetical protein